MKIEEMPSATRKNIEKISQDRGIEISELLEEFDKEFNAEYVKGYTPEARAVHAGNIVWSHYMRKQPVLKPFLVIPFGVREQWRAKNGWRAELHCLIKETESSKYTMREIVFTGAHAEQPSKIELLKAYKDVSVLDQGAWMEADNTTKFANPIDIKDGEEEFFTKRLKFPKITPLREIAEYQSELDDSGYTKKFSQYIIEGLVVRYGKGQRRDNSIWANYTINDSSLPREEEIVEKTILSSEITVWVPSRFLKYDKDSELSFVGTISRDTDKKPSMNAYYLYPSGIVRMLEE